MSKQSAYDSAMNDARKLLTARLDELIGHGKMFKSARELAQRAHTMGLVENVEHFTRTVNRVRKNPDMDVQLKTIEAISGAANTTVADLLADEQMRTKLLTLEQNLREERARSETLRAALNVLSRRDDNSFGQTMVVTANPMFNELANRPFAELLDAVGGAESLTTEEIEHLWFEIRVRPRRDAVGTQDSELSPIARMIYRALTSGKPVDTGKTAPDPKDLINKTREAARASANAERAGSTGDDGPGRRHVGGKQRH